MSVFSERLVLLRKEREVTQEQIAKILCKRRSTVSGYETEGKEPDFESLVIIANYFGVSCDYLLGRTDYRTDSNDILYHDSQNLKKIVGSLRSDSKHAVARAYDAFYALLESDLKDGCFTRLLAYAEFFELLANERSSLQKTVQANSDKLSEPAVLTQLMSEQNALKNDVSLALDKVFQADMELCLCPHKKGGTPKSSERRAI